MLEIKQISKNFEFQKHFGEKKINLKVLEDINFKLDNGENLVIFGDSGSGKSTLAKIIASVLNQSSGEIFIDGQNVKHIKNIRQKIRLVLQNQKESLNPALKISRQIKFVKYYLKLNFDNEKIENLREFLNLKPNIFDKFSYELSGGEASRVGILIALLSNPQILILDEITNGLDNEVKEKILDLLQKLDISVIFITHELESAIKISDKFLILKNGKQKFFGNYKEFEFIENF